MKRPSAAMASASSSVTQRTWATSSDWSFRAFRSTSRSTRKKSSNPWGKFTLSVARTPVRSRGYPSSSQHSRSAAIRLSSPASTPPAADTSHRSGQITLQEVRCWTSIRPSGAKMQTCTTVRYSPGSLCP